MVKKGKLKFDVQERLLCYHNHLIYEAKCIETNINHEENKPYKIHYQGWNKNWDEWVAEERLLKYNETNLNLQKKLQSDAAQSAAPKSKKKKSSLANQSTSLADSTLGSNAGDSTPSNNAINQEKTESVSDSLPASGDEDSQQPTKLEKIRPEVKIKLSEEIIGWLIDDENQMKQKRLAVLPAKPNVQTILKDFVKHKKSVSKLSTEKELILSEMTLGLTDYFDVMLGPQLLYKFERPQYQTIMKDHGRETSAASLYGIIHLLRLLTRIGPMLKYVDLKEDSISSIVGHIHELVRYLNKYAGPLFKVEDIYQIATPDYIKRVAAL